MPTTLVRRLISVRSLPPSVIVMLAATRTMTAATAEKILCLRRSCLGLEFSQRIVGFNLRQRGNLVKRTRDDRRQEVMEYRMRSERPNIKGSNRVTTTQRMHCSRHSDASSTT